MTKLMKTARARRERKAGARSQLLNQGPGPVAIVRGYDLRWSSEDKYADASAHARWTVFVNAAGTLCHLVVPAAGIVLKGVKLPRVAGWNRRAIEELLAREYGPYINLS